MLLLVTLTIPDFWAGVIVGALAAAALIVSVALASARSEKEDS